MCSVTFLRTRQAQRRMGAVTIRVVIIVASQCSRRPNLSADCTGSPPASPYRPVLASFSLVQNLHDRRPARHRSRSMHGQPRAVTERPPRRPLLLVVFLRIFHIFARIHILVVSCTSSTQARRRPCNLHADQAGQACRSGQGLSPSSRRIATNCSICKIVDDEKPLGQEPADGHPLDWCCCVASLRCLEPA